MNGPITDRIEIKRVCELWKKKNFFTEECITNIINCCKLEPINENIDVSLSLTKK